MLGEELKGHVDACEECLERAVNIPRSHMRLDIAKGIRAHLPIECMPPADCKAAPVPAMKPVSLREKRARACTSLRLLLFFGTI